MNSFYLFLLWRYKPTSKIGPAGVGHLVYPLVSLSLVLGVVTNSPGKVMTDDFSGKFLKGIPAPILPPWIASLVEVSSRRAHPGKAHKERNRGIWPTTLAVTYVKLSLWAP